MIFLAKSFNESQERFPSNSRLHKMWWKFISADNVIPTAPPWMFETNFAEVPLNIFALKFIQIHNPSFVAMDRRSEGKQMVPLCWLNKVSELRVLLCVHLTGELALFVCWTENPSKNSFICSNTHLLQQPENHKVPRDTLNLFSIHLCFEILWCCWLDFYTSRMLVLRQRSSLPVIRSPAETYDEFPFNLRHARNLPWMKHSSGFYFGINKNRKLKWVNYSRRFNFYFHFSYIEEIFFEFLSKVYYCWVNCLRMWATFSIVRRCDSVDLVASSDVQQNPIRPHQLFTYF